MSLNHPLRYLVQTLAGMVLCTALIGLTFAWSAEPVEAWAIGVAAAVHAVLVYQVTWRFVRARKNFIWLIAAAGAASAISMLGCIALAAFISPSGLYQTVSYSSARTDQNWLVLATSALILGLSAGVAGTLFWFMRKRPKYFAPGQCAACGYDLRGSTDSRTCPECGKRLLPGFDLPRRNVGA